MKRIIFFFCVIIFLKGQGNDPYSRYKQALEEAEAELRAFPADTGEGGVHHEYERKNWFSGYRFPATANEKALKKASAAPLNCNTPNNSAWELLGPVQDIPNNRNVNDLGIVVSLAVNPLDSNIIYAGSRTGGLWRGDISQSPVKWRCLTDNTKLPVFGVTAIAIDPTDTNNIYVGIGYDYLFQPSYLSSGVLMSKDGGNTWQLANLPASPGLINKIIVNPQNPNTVYVQGKYYIYRSLNKGASWDTVLSTASAGLKVYIDTTKKTVTLGTFTDMEMMPGNTSVLFVSSDCDFSALLKHLGGKCIPYSSNGAKIFFTHNGGNSWQEVFAKNNTESRSLYINLATTPADPSNVYAAFIRQKAVPTGSTDSCKALTLTIDSTCINAYNLLGLRTRQRTNLNNYKLLPAKIDRFTKAFAISPTDPNVMYFEELGGLYYSCNGYGRTLMQYFYALDSFYCDFFDYNKTVHADQRDILILRGSASGDTINNDHILLGNDGGVSFSDDGGASWQSLNGEGLAITQFYGIDVAKNSPHLIAGGTQDNGFYVYDNGHWYNSIIGDGAEVLFLPNNDNLLWVQGWGLSKFTSLYQKNGINSWSSPWGSSYTNNSSYYVRPMEVYGDTLFMPTNVIQKTRQDIVNFQTHSVIPGQFISIRSMDICDSDSSIMFVAFNKVIWEFDSCAKIFFRSMDYGKTWQDLTDSVRKVFTYYPCVVPIGDIEINPDKPNEMWICFGGFEPKPGGNPPYNGRLRVYHSTDYGDTWEDYSEGLSPFPVNKVVYDPRDGILYAATDVGVFYTIPATYPTTGWKCFNNDLPVLIVTDLVTDYVANRLVIGTFGRGIWTSPRYCPDRGTYIEHVLPVAPGFYYGEVIHSFAEVDSGNVTYKATAEITLAPGFTASADNGTVFHAYIGNCSPLPTPSSIYKMSPPAKAPEFKTSSPEVSDKLKVFPNPTRSSIKVEISEKTSYRLLDLNGKLIFQGELLPEQGEINLSALPDGVYILQIIQGKSKSSYKLRKF